MIKTTIGQLLNAVGYFPTPQGAPYGRLAQLSLPAGQAMKLVKLGYAIDKEVNAFRKVHQGLATEDIPPGDPQHNPDNEGEQKRLTAEALEELNALLAETITLNAEKLKIEAMAHVPMTGADMFALSFLFEGLEREEEKPANKGNGKGAPNPKPKNKHKLAAVPASI